MAWTDNIPTKKPFLEPPLPKKEKRFIVGVHYIVHWRASARVEVLIAIIRKQLQMQSGPVKCRKSRICTQRGRLEPPLSKSKFLSRFENVRNEYLGRVRKSESCIVFGFGTAQEKPQGGDGGSQKSLYTNRVNRSGIPALSLLMFVRKFKSNPLHSMDPSMAQGLSKTVTLSAGCLIKLHPAVIK